MLGAQFYLQVNLTNKYFDEGISHCSTCRWTLLTSTLVAVC